MKQKERKTIQQERKKERRERERERERERMMGFTFFADYSAGCLASVPDGRLLHDRLEVEWPPVSAGPLSGGRAASLTALSPMYSTGSCCSV